MVVLARVLNIKPISVEKATFHENSHVTDCSGIASYDEGGLDFLRTLVCSAIG